MQPTQVVIDPELCERAPDLKRYLELLYLQGGQYVLIFSVHERKAIDWAFDQIIRDHGILPEIDFIYQIELLD